jgi:hypothetical protein
MKKLLLSLSALAAPFAAQAIVIPIFFPFTPTMSENFDTFTPGTYSTHPVFGGFGTTNMIGTGGLLVVDNFQVPALSAPNCFWGRGVDVEWKVPVPMRRFGGWFRRVQVGVVINSATFRFYDASNNPLGSMTVPLTNTWTWRGFRTLPAKWSRVEVIGNGPFPGLVAHDDVRIRFN